MDPSTSYSEEACISARITCVPLRPQVPTTTLAHKCPPHLSLPFVTNDHMTGRHPPFFFSPNTKKGRKAAMREPRLKMLATTKALSIEPATTTAALGEKCTVRLRRAQGQAENPRRKNKISLFTKPPLPPDGLLIPEEVPGRDPQHLPLECCYKPVILPSPSIH